MGPGFFLLIAAASIAAGVIWQGRHGKPEHAGRPPALPPPAPPIIPPAAPAPAAPAPAAATAPRGRMPIPVISNYDSLPIDAQTGVPTHMVNLNDPMIARWHPLVYGSAVVWGPRMHADYKQLTQFAMAWLGIESGGNECAVGNKYTVVPPGNAPREIGLWQIYNPDDFKKLGIDPLELVSYCVRPAAGQPNPQKLAHPTTDAQKARHVDIGMQVIADKRAYADHYLGASGVRWPNDSPDHWRMVKAVHALPVLANTAIAQVTKRLGRAPSSWHEYRSTYEAINHRARYVPGKPRGEQDGYWRALENAEWTGGQVSPLPNV